MLWYTMNVADALREKPAMQIELVQGEAQSTGLNQLKS
jgi:hypothetical protein